MLCMHVSVEANARFWFRLVDLLHRLGYLRIQTHPLLLSLTRGIYHGVGNFPRNETTENRPIIHRA